MLTIARQRLQKDEEDGFTLIELMVVVLIIAILLAIAIPTFLGAQDRARDRGAQSDLRNGLTAAKTIATDDAGLFTNVDAVELQLTEGALNFDTAADPDFIDVVGGGAALEDEVLFFNRSASDNWFAISTNSQGEVAQCTAGDADAGPTATVVANHAGCLAAETAGDDW